MTPTSTRTRRTTAGTKVAASVLPIARVAVDVSLAHLDRPFDYQVADSDSDAAQPGTRVRVRFAGRLLDGYVLERLATSEHEGKLGFIEKVVSPEPILTPDVAQLARAVADRYAGSMADVLRLAVPPRHARAEGTSGFKAVAPPPLDEPVFVEPVGPAPTPPEIAPVDRAAWKLYQAGDAFLSAVRDGRPVRAVWQALPGEDWPARLAEAAATAARAGRGALLVVPDARDLERLERALLDVLDKSLFVTLAADLGPAERYRRYLKLSRGDVRVAAGTRAAAFAPVKDLALVAVFDDGDDLLSEPRAPYPHTREVLMLRSAAQPCALVVGGFARTAEAELLLASGWARPVVADRATVRARSPRIEAAGDEYAIGADSAAAGARLTPAAFAAARAALAAGRPVLVQVPRRGYLPTLNCAECRRPARCRHCHGPLALGGSNRLPACRWCGVAEAHFNCPACGSGTFRTSVVGARRTAEELGRAFPGAQLITSSGDTVRSSVPAEPAIVVATPGAEPAATGGYGAALLLDGYALLGRADLRAAEEAMRRWMAAAALVVPAAEGGRVVVGADSTLPTVQALIRWDPAGHAAAELAARTELGFPPAVAMASLQGEETVAAHAAESLRLPEGGEILGPVLLEDLPPPTGSRARGPAPAVGTARVLVRVPPSGRRQLAAEIKALAAARSTRKDDESLRLRIDPDELF
ncbi:replication restart DNA helicase PriA [Nakamurella panacisegetis]|uniref:Probable replication restart protein PriA n=1 Tax=Nakamurella panacisegetis TaxID=1090615 RepID=A0A1H0PL84_9ACTN|nr:primosomal protein N' [Nakamurella panacisegetis]SDP05388.1 replication restart DNA helicase PriA [Nakamurella panacisegetis]